ncbi:class II aldolase/adducin family protein [Roseivirga sp. E12]|uniref:class II aldolase/adducin family protein n=1 Tax=Roseivirga sp. E12 TaxID=2819237 RepID=UPI001ABCA7C7|nr:class II aldolase/adducin family protein [Roseivirga sp. E12]MBO3697883.1 class II aldolase/adducin family protein [Roseivirga sp. E12]
MDDGYIKFKIDWQEGSAPDYPEMDDLIMWRDRMYDMGLIGYDENYKVGFGNISILPSINKNFIISGTQTGHIERLKAEHFTEVTDYSITKNQLSCLGPVKASSESLTHAAIYEADQNIRAVIHIHHDQQWEAWLDQIPTTNKDVPYGTPEMAFEIARLFKENNSFNLLAMAGHQGGLIAFGENLKEAAQPFLEVLG